ncbi:TniQ family protein [Deinococcus sp. HMF7604]|uniref:TniQ family protein n=1 Tax=Deinococcus betulae TaxID=2873312 RepID=UPI001CCBE995|nr:TniQ family protein [Deinococcus betulae]MBZ9752496.1 TniQ family protein [Deinococcus betulae]
MRIGLRQFTFAPRPKLGQSFASYMETTAAELVPPVDLLTLLLSIGIIEEDHQRALPIAYGMTLTEQQIDNMSFTLRLSRQDIAQLLLTHYDGRVFTLAPMDPRHKNASTSAVRKNSTLFTTQRLCPCCMQEEPYFRLAHRLPWMFLCSTHKVLLSSTCPRCVRPHGNFRQSMGGMPSYPTVVPDPRTCRNPPATGEADAGRAAQSCGQPLAELVTTDVSGYPRVLHAQKVIEDVLSTGQGQVSGEMVTGVEYFDYLRSVLSLLDYGADPEDLGEGLPPIALETARRHAVERGFGKDAVKRRYRSSPTTWTPEWMCAFLPTAVELLASSTLDTLSENLSPLLDQARRFKTHSFRTLSKYFKLKGLLLKAFDTAVLPQASAKRRSGYISPYSHHPDRPYAFEPDAIPQLLWPRAYMEEFAPLFEGTEMGSRHIRSFITMDLVRLCGEYSWVEAARELGFLPGQATGSANKAVGLLNSRGVYSTYLERLHNVAAHLESVESPFNFGQCRRRFADLLAFPFEDWRLEMQARDLHPGKPGGKNKWAAAHAWALLTAGHPRRAPVFRELGEREYKNQLEIFYRFNRDHLDNLWPLIRALSIQFTDFETLAGEAELGAQEK